MADVKTAPAREYKYHAFISYSRVDRKVAVILQRSLERYVLPKAMKLRGEAAGQKRRPFPRVFRDEDELVPGGDLPARIREGLENSEFLIVVCSPQSAESAWVEKEILDFIALGGENRILGVVVAGEPNAVRRGLDEKAEALALPLRRVVASGQITEQAAEDPLWVDWRGQKRDDRLNFLRVVAALLGLQSFDDLIRRDQQAERSRRLVAQGVAGAIALIGVVAIVLGFSAFLERQEALRTQSRFLADLARQSIDQGQVDSAMLLALEGLPAAHGTVLRREWVPEPEAQLRRALYANRELKRISNLSSFACVDGNKPCHPLDAAVHPSKEVVASRLPDNTIRIWNPETELEIRRLRPRDGKLLDHVTFSPDGTHLLEYGWHQIRVWDIEIGAEVAARTFDRENRYAYSAHGAYIVSTDQNGIWRAFDARLSPLAWIRSGEQIPSVQAISPNEERALTFQAGRVVIRNMKTGTEVLRLKTPRPTETEILGASFSPDGARLFVLYDRVLGRTYYRQALARIYDGRSGAVLADIENVMKVAFSPDNTRIVVAYHQATARIYDALSGHVSTQLKGSADGSEVDDLSFSPDGKRVVISGGWFRPYPQIQSAQRIWDSRTGNELASIDPDCQGEIETFNSDGTFLLTKKRLTSLGSNSAYRMGVCDAESGRELFNFSGHEHHPPFHDGEVHGIFGPNNRWLITEQQRADPESLRDIGSEIRLWVARITKPLLELSNQKCPDKIYCGLEQIVFDPQGTRVAGVGRSDDQNGTIKIWDLRHQQVTVIRDIKLPVLSLTFSPDGGQIAATSYDWARVFNAISGKVIHDLGKPGCCSVTAGFSAVGTTIIGVFGGDSISRWNAESGHLVRTIHLSRKPVFGVAINHRGTRLLRISSDGLDLIDTDNGDTLFHIAREAIPLETRSEFIRAIGFSIDDSTMFVVAGKAGVAIWDAATGTLVSEINKTASSLIGGGISSSGKFVLTISINGSLPGIAQLWDTKTGAELGRIDSQSNDVSSVAFAPDGWRLAIGSAGGTARIVSLLPEDSKSLVDLACGRRRDEVEFPENWSLPKGFREIPASSQERFFLAHNSVGPCDRSGLLTWQYYRDTAKIGWEMVKVQLTAFGASFSTKPSPAEAPASERKAIPSKRSPHAAAENKRLAILGPSSEHETRLIDASR